MKPDTTGLLAQRIVEVATWCSLQKLTGVHKDSPDEARRRELMNEAGLLLATARYPGDSRFQRYLPSGRRWTRAMNLIKESDPDSLAPLEHQLRSAALKPAESIGSCSGWSTREIVDSVIEHRSSLLKSQLPLGHDVSPNQLRGRILLYVPSENVSDGASRYASNGFYDPYDCPPWDLWLQHSDRTLSSWVPEALFPTAQAGIDANAVDCIKWAD